MLEKIGFVLFLVGAGMDGNLLVSAIFLLSGLLILWNESRKIDAPADQSKSVY